MISVVIPVLDEAQSLPQLHLELSQVAAQNAYDIEMIFIDDGSRDRSWAVVEELASNDPRVRGIRFRRNFGKAAALQAGFQAARGEMIFTLDADLQDDPREMPKFLTRLNESLDVVSGWKRQRFDPWHKVFPSRVFNRLVSRMTGVRLHDHNCGYKCFRREVLERLRLYGELHRFIPVLAAARGWRVGEVVVEHRRRVHGRSKFGIWRIPKGFLDLLTVKFLTAYGQRPQHMLGAVGLSSLSAGFVVLLILIARWALALAWPTTVAFSLTSNPWFYLALVAMLFGGQFLAAGFLAELVTAQNGRDVPPYWVSDVTRNDRDRSETSERMTDDATNHRDGAIGGPHWSTDRTSGMVRETP